MAKETMRERLLSKRKDWETKERDAKRSGDFAGVKKAKAEIANINQLLEEWGDD